MRDCWLVLALVLYLSLDVTNPLMPGAVTFGVENPVELRQAERFRGYHDAAAPVQSFDRVPRRDSIYDELVINALRSVEPASTASPPVRRARSSLFASSALSDDPLTRRS